MSGTERRMDDLIGKQQPASDEISSHRTKLSWQFSEESMRKVISLASVPILAFVLGIGVLGAMASPAKAAGPEYSLQCGWDPGGWVAAPCSPLRPQPQGAFLAVNTGEVFAARVENATAREVYPRTLFSYHRAVTNWQRCIAAAADPLTCGPYPTFP